MRVSVATALTAAVALLLLLLPRAFLAPLVSALRPDEMPIAPVNEPLRSAYPPELFVGRDGETAAVYALGPGPYRHVLRVDAGSDRGIGEGDVAVLPNADTSYVLVGRVTRVSAKTAEIETVYDPAWKTAVRIGSSSVDALLVGGLTPSLTLIPKGAPVAEGDAVVSADPAFPYGLVLGTVTDLRDAEDGVLREATLATPYALAGLRALDLIDVRN